MKKTLLVLAILAIASMPAFAGDNPMNGAHYNLNNIGLQKCSNHGDWSGDCFNGNAGDIVTNGHTLFVPLEAVFEKDGKSP